MDQHSVYSRHSQRSRRRRRQYNTASKSVKSFSSTSTLAVTQIKIYELTKWQNLSKGIWFAMVVETNPCSNKESINGFLDALEWLRIGEISDLEFNNLYEAWICEKQSEPKPKYYNIIEDQILVSFVSFRKILMDRKYSIADLESISSILIKEANKIELKKHYFTPTWLMLIDSLFFSMDLLKSGILTIDDLLLLCVVLNPNKFILYNDKKQQITDSLSKLRSSGNLEFTFSRDLTNDTLTRLSAEAYDLLFRLGSRDITVNSPYSGVISLFVFKQQIKRMAVKSNSSHVFSENNIKHYLTQLHKLKESLKNTNFYKRRQNTPMLVSLWQECVISNTIGNTPDSLKLCMFLCHQASLIRWQKYKRDSSWHSKEQVHQIWLHFLDINSNINSSVSSTLFLQLENSVNLYVSRIVKQLLTRKRDEISYQKETYPQEVVEPLKIRTDEEIGSCGRQSVRSTNTYNNFHFSIAAEQRNLTIPQQLKTEATIKKQLQEMSTRYKESQEKYNNSDAINEFNKKAALNGSVSISGSQFDVFQKINSSSKLNIDRNVLLQQSAKSDVHQNLSNFQNLNSQANVMSSRSLIKTTPNAKDEVMLSKISEKYEEEDNMNSGVFIVYHSEVFVLAKSTWTLDTMVVKVKYNLFYLYFENEKSEVCLKDCKIRPVISINSDKQRHRLILLHVNDVSIQYEIALHDNQTREYLLKLFSFAISTSRTNFLMKEQEDSQIGIETGRISSRNLKTSELNRADSTSTIEKELFEGNKSVSNSDHGGNYIPQVPKRPPPLLTPRPVDLTNNGYRYISSQTSFRSSNSVKSSRSGVGDGGAAALERLTLATEQLRKALVSD